MKILFLCGSAEPGKDGVGDYTRRLCGELIRTGHQAQIVSLCDKQVPCLLIHTQIIEDTPVLVSRIPISTSYSQRLTWTQEIVIKVAPDWISLQFVPYSYHPKGLPFWLSGFLMKLKGEHQWQIMFHELWIGIEKEASFKYKCIGFIQKQLIRKINKNIAPKQVYTQAKIYQHYLNKINIKGYYLPLFGNVSVTATKNRNSELSVFVVFATIHDKAPFEDFIIDLQKVMQEKKEEIKFIFIGRNGNLLTSWTAILDQYTIKYEVLGRSTEIEISQILMNGDFGISSTPYKISDKSGVLAAMREHQLPIINVAKPWMDQDVLAISFEDIVHYKKGNLPLNKFSGTADNSLKNVCLSFFKTIANN